MFTQTPTPGAILMWIRNLLDSREPPITIAVVGDTTPELDETFFVNLGDASTNAIIVNGHGIGNIHDDDLPSMPGDPGTECTPDNVYYPAC
jgi:hypothetical protein